MGKHRRANPTATTVPAAGPAAAKDGYHVLEQSESRERRRASIEYGDEATQFPAFGRLQSVNVLRDLYRNYSSARCLLWQFRIHVIGCGQKVTFHTGTDFDKAAESHFNNYFAKHADARDDRNLHDLNAALLLSVIREHDCVVYFDLDGGVTGGDSKGKLWTWETDQICDIDDKDWKKDEVAAAIRGSLAYPAGDMTQQQGCIQDKWGRTLGYIVTAQHGMASVPYKDVTVLRRGWARLLKHPWRLNQTRGSSDMLTAACQLVDTYELLKAELASAKVAAHLGIQITQKDSDTAAQGRADVSEKGANGVAVTDAIPSSRKKYNAYEKLSRGAIEYMEPGEEAKVLDNTRPSYTVKDFAEFETIMAGASMGLPRLYSMLKADASYSASRAEMNLGDGTFEVWQKWLERYVLDFEVVNATQAGQDVGAVPALNLKQWVDKFSFIHPVQKSIDVLKDALADTERLNNRTSTLAELIGPHWEDHIAQLGKERKALDAAGIKNPADALPVKPQQPSPDTNTAAAGE